MEIDKRCFKIDRPNASAMINGYPKNGKNNRQSIWCAVATMPFPMLITLNRSPTHFKVNKHFKHRDLERFAIPYKYIATLDSEYFIKNDFRLWKKICRNGLFDVWDPGAPYTRFGECRSDPSKYRIQLLRLFEIKEEFDETDINPVSDRIDHLNTSSRSVKIKRPIITNKKFENIKSLLNKSVSRFRQ